MDTSEITSAVPASQPPTEGASINPIQLPAEPESVAAPAPAVETPPIVPAFNAEQELAQSQSSITGEAISAPDTTGSIVNPAAQPAVTTEAPTATPVVVTENNSQTLWDKVKGIFQPKNSAQ